MNLLVLAYKSLLSRRVTAGLTITAIAFSVALLLGVEKVRTGAREGFTSTISGTDLIVGARGGRIQLLLYSVFRIGSPNTNVSWDSFETLSESPLVQWAVPLSMGDSHRGYRVVGTTGDYFDHYRYGQKTPLSLKEGNLFQDTYDAVIGADAAKKLGYEIGTELELSHGIDSLGLHKHEDNPFRISGILARTGTPVDRTIHVSLEGLEAIHEGFDQDEIHHDPLSVERLEQVGSEPESVTAILVGLKSRPSALALQQTINNHQEEPLLAIMPGVTLQELWQVLGTAESALLAISVMVVLTSLLCLVAMTLAGLNERRREIAILRSVGARPSHIFLLLTCEAGLISFIGAAAGVILLYVLMFIGQPLITARYGLYVPISAPGLKDQIIIATLILSGFLAGAVPAYRAYRYSVGDSLGGGV